MVPFNAVQLDGKQIENPCRSVPTPRPYGPGSSYLTSWNLKTTSGQHLSLGCWWGINFVPTKSPDDRSDSLVAIDAARCHAGNLGALGLSRTMTSTIVWTLVDEHFANNLPIGIQDDAGI